MKKAILSLAIFVIVLVLALGSVLYLRERKLDAFAGTPFGPKGAKVVEIPPTGPKALSELLAQHGVVADADLFYRLIRKDHAARHLKHGEYEFELPATPEQVLQKIVKGEQKAYHFTIPEGLRVDEILPLLASSELHLDEQKLWELAKNPAFVRGLGIPADSLEGFLFPDTYTFTRGYTEKSVLTKMVESALAAYRKADARRKPGVKLNLLQTATLASIVEKETGAPEERSHISCVFHNRLRLGMKLQTDPTVLYAMMLLRGHFVKNITSKDLVTPSPYNTYVVKGLPPGPIANPGEAAIVAALDPLDCRDLYFVSRNNGTSVFCPDLRCHDAAVRKWQVEFFRKQHRAEAQRR